MPSAGCGKDVSQTLNQWVESTVMSGSGTRPYSVRLPNNYDPMRPYPVIMLLHGCSSGTNNVPMERQTGTDAILVRGTGSAANVCWDTAANGPDVAFFDAMVADAKARFCTDTGRLFVVGYSSGSWLTNQLTCIRGNVVRAVGTIAGGESSRGMCSGRVAHMFIHDQNDNDNVIAGSERARDRLLTQNGCDRTAAARPARAVAVRSLPGLRGRLSRRLVRDERQGSRPPGRSRTGRVLELLQGVLRIGCRHRSAPPHAAAWPV